MPAILSKKISQKIAVLLGCGILLISSCTKIPPEGSIAPDISYKNRKQNAISGLRQNIGTFQASKSSLPLKFEIESVRELSGKSISALTDKVPVINYKSAVVGNETPAELAIKSDTVMVPAAGINEYTGVLEFQEGNRIPAGEYHFDISVSNTSGSRLLKDALVVEFKEFDIISWSSGMARKPEIEKVGDTPNQIRFMGYLNGKQLSGEDIDFTKNRAAGFKGKFVNDTNEGEVWSVNFPVKESNTYCTWRIVDAAGVVSYQSLNFNFVIGTPGSYVIKLYK